MNNYLNKALRWSRRLSFVPRWVVVPVLRRQSVAEHCFHVARTVLWLGPQHAQWHRGSAAPDSMQLTFKLACLEKALTHDDDEASSGDRPSPSKLSKPYDAMTQIEIVNKCADLLEAMAFVHEERAMGNMHGMDVVHMDLQAKFHDCWVFFDWGAWDRSKPLASDMIKDYLEQICPTSHHYKHPVLEGRDA